MLDAALLVKHLVELLGLGAVRPLVGEPKRDAQRGLGLEGLLSGSDEALPQGPRLGGHIPTLVANEERAQPVGVIHLLGPVAGVHDLPVIGRQGLVHHDAYHPQGLLETMIAEGVRGGEGRRGEVGACAGHGWAALSWELR